MAETRHLIVELRHSDGRKEQADEALLESSSITLDTRSAPSIEGLSLDPSFAPVEVPALHDVDLPSTPRDVGELFALSDDYTESTYIVRATADDDNLDAVVEQATGNAAVVGIYADIRVEPQAICPGDPPLGNHGDVERLLCTDALKRCGMDGSGVLVAIVDTGINMDYLNAQGKNPGFDAARSWVPEAGLVPGELPVGHGTMCAFDACIAAPKCTLLDIALLQSSRQGGSVMEGFLSDGVLAYRHLLNIMLAPKRPGECRSLVVNNSWGMFHPSWDFPVGHPGNYSDNPNHPFNRIVAALDRAGADILFAAGNCGPDCPDGRCQGVTADAIYGANSHPQVLSVAGVDTTKDRVGYSSVGPGRLMKAKPDIASYTHFKGSGVYAADGGTSAATPVAAGVVAAVRTILPYDGGQPGTSPAAMRNMITKTAEDRGLLGYDYEYGWGIINGCALAEHLCKKKDDTCCDYRSQCCRCCRCCCKSDCCGRGGGCGGCCDGCGGGDKKLPDLMPRPGANGSFCRRENGELIVTVCNRGDGPAGPSTTTVDFGQHGSVDVPTPGIPAGGCVEVRATIPPGCFDPDCEFRIIVDSAGVITESDETNNFASGRCLG